MQNVKGSGETSSRARLRARLAPVGSTAGAVAEQPALRCHSLSSMGEGSSSSRTPGQDAAGSPGQDAGAGGESTGRTPRTAGGPRAFDGVSSFMGMRWDDPQTVRLKIRPELINGGGLLSGVATYALVDYCMGSTLWVETTEGERIATINIAINYIQTAIEGEIICKTVLDRRNRTIGIMKSEVRHEDGRLLVTATGSYSIFARKPSRA
jgi:uncharacterized protein (TIGR00369 family)